MTATVVVAVTLAIVFLTETVEPCSDQFVKDMVVKVCGLERSGTDIDWSTFGRNSSISYYPKSNRKYSPRLRAADNDKNENINFLPTVGGVDVPEPRNSLRYKDLTDLIRECCVRQCTIDDFRGVCGKK